MTLAVGFRIASGDVAAVNGVLVRYKVDGKIEHEQFRQAVIACVEPSPCKASIDDASDFSDSVLRRFGLVPND